MAFYVTAKHYHHPNKTLVLAGPYNTHGAALAAEPLCAREVDRRAKTPAQLVQAFDTITGTARCRNGRAQLGIFNDAVGYSGPGQLP